VCRDLWADSPAFLSRSRSSFSSDKLKATATHRAGDLKAIVDDIRRSGITSVRGIAEELHVRGIRAPRGDTWHPTAVSRLLSRLSA
jgi:hypothetical protein